MKTVLNVKTDTEVKEQAQALAKHLGVPLSVVVNAYLREFVRSGEFALRAVPTVKPAVAKRIEKAVNDNTASPKFTDAAGAMKWLQS